MSEVVKIRPYTVWWLHEAYHQRARRVFEWVCDQFDLGGSDEDEWQMWISWMLSHQSADFNCDEVQAYRDMREFPG